MFCDLLSAGTTEKIFEMKTQLYDIYVDNQNVTAHVPAMQELLKLSDADKDKFQKLNNERFVFLFLENTDKVSLHRSHVTRNVQVSFFPRCSKSTVERPVTRLKIFVLAMNFAGPRICSLMSTGSKSHWTRRKYSPRE